jgi:hypothetical protein
MRVIPESFDKIENNVPVLFGEIHEKQNSSVLGLTYGAHPLCKMTKK